MAVTCPTCKVPFESEASMTNHHGMAHADEWEDRFWYHVDRRGDGECWPWTGTVGSVNGYGWMSVGGESVHAHRLAYEIEYDERPSSVMHVCDDRTCVNPTHLIAGGMDADG